MRVHRAEQCAQRSATGSCCRCSAHRRISSSLTPPPPWLESDAAFFFPISSFRLSPSPFPLPAILQSTRVGLSRMFRHSLRGRFDTKSMRKGRERGRKMASNCAREKEKDEPPPLPPSSTSDGLHLVSLLSSLRSPPTPPSPPLHFTRLPPPYAFLLNLISNISSNTAKPRTYTQNKQPLLPPPPAAPRASRSSRAPPCPPSASWPARPA